MEDIEFWLRAHRGPEDRSGSKRRLSSGRWPQSSEKPTRSRSRRARRSFDHAVGAREEALRHVKAERPGGPEIDHELIFGRRLYRQIGRLLAFENAVDVAGRATELSM
jgi:hypothetical protein